MKQLIIDCRTGKAVYVELSPEAESQRLQEVETQRGQQMAEEKRAAKRHLAKALAELREMRQNRDVFDEADLAEKQVEIDLFKGAL